MENDWLKNLKDTMEDFGEAAPEGLWDEVESRAFPKKRTFALPWLWRGVSVAAVVALGVFATLRLTDNAPSSPETPQVQTIDSKADDQLLADVPEVTAEEDLPETAIGGEAQKAAVKGDVQEATVDVEVLEAAADGKTAVDNAGAALTADVANVGAAEGTEHAVSGSGSVKAEPETIAEPSKADLLREKAIDQVTEPESQRDKRLADASGIAANGLKTNDEGHREEADEYAKGGFGNLPLDYWPESEESESDEPRRPSIDASVSGLSSARGRSSVYNPSRFYHGSMPTMSNSSGSGGSDYRSSTRAHTLASSSAVSETVVTTPRHKRPIKVSLVANYPITNTIGIESGVSFTRLETTFTSTSDANVTETKQTLNYVGIPLNLTATIFSARLFDFYGTVGGAVEKCVSGTTKPVQWSVNGGLGVQANVTGNIGIYVEPGASYHFDDGTTLVTIYKDRPLDFSLAFGIRYSF